MLFLRKNKGTKENGKIEQRTLIVTLKYLFTCRGEGKKKNLKKRKQNKTIMQLRISPIFLSINFVLRSLHLLRFIIITFLFYNTDLTNEQPTEKHI